MKKYIKSSEDITYIEIYPYLIQGDKSGLVIYDTYDRILNRDTGATDKVKIKKYEITPYKLHEFTNYTTAVEKFEHKLSYDEMKNTALSIVDKIRGRYNE